jgi:hypothetical protein
MALTLPIRSESGEENMPIKHLSAKLMPCWGRSVLARRLLDGLAGLFC